MMLMGLPAFSHLTTRYILYTLRLVRVRVLKVQPIGSAVVNPIGVLFFLYPDHVNISRPG